MQNATDLLKKDHERIKKLFRAYRESGDSFEEKAGLADLIFREIEVHSALEEEIFYPFAESELDESGQDLVREAVEEHALVKDLIEDLKTMDTEDPEFDAKMSVLIENVLAHIGEEEGGLFPMVESLSEDLDEVSDELTERKEELGVTAH